MNGTIGNIWSSMLSLRSSMLSLISAEVLFILIIVILTIFLSSINESHHRNPAHQNHSKKWMTVDREWLGEEMLTEGSGWRSKTDHGHHVTRIKSDTMASFVVVERFGERINDKKLKRYEEMLTIGYGRRSNDHHVTRSKSDTTCEGEGHVGAARMRKSACERFRVEEVKHTTASSEILNKSLQKPYTFETLPKDLENQGIIDDLSRFVGNREYCKSIDRAWKRGYLLYEPPGTDRSSLIVAMAKYLKFDIYHLDVRNMSSISELTNMLVSIRNRSLIVIKDVDLPNLKNELTGSCLLKFLDGLLSSCGGEKIILLTTNHRDLYDAAQLRPFNMDIHIHTSSPQPIALPDGGEIVDLDSSEQKPSLDFDAANNSAYQSGFLMSNSEKKNTIEESERWCMTESVHSLVDSMTRRSAMDFDALDSRAHLVIAHQSSPIIAFDSEKKDTREGLYGECLTKSVLSFDDSTKRKLLPDFVATENKAHLVRAYQSGPIVSLSDNKNRGEAVKGECITKSILDLEDLQQHSGGRRDAAEKSFSDNISWKSFEVETLPPPEQPNDCVPLSSLGRLRLEGCVQQEKSPDLPRVIQVNKVEQRVTKSPRYLQGLTAQFASSSRWPISLPDGRHIGVPDPLEQSTKNVACSPTVSLPDKKMVRKKLKRECRTTSVIEIHQQHFGRRCEGAAKSFRATRICGKHQINWVSTVERIYKQHRIHQCPFRQNQRWATRKGYSLSDERPFEASNLSTDEKLDSRLLFILLSQFARSSPQPLALPDGGHIVWSIALSSREFAAANNRAHLVRQDQSGSTASRYKGKSARDTLGRQGITMSLCSVEDLHQHFGCKHKDAVRLVNMSMFKSTCRLHQVYWRPCRNKSNEQQAFDATNNRAHLAKADQSSPTVSNSEKENTREALKRECVNNSVLSLEDLRRQYGGRHKDVAKGLGDTLAWKSFKVLDVFPLLEQSNSIRHLMPRRRLALKRWARPKKSQNLPRTLRVNRSGGLAAQLASSLHWPICLSNGGHIVSVSVKKIVTKTFKRKRRTMSVSFEDHNRRFGSRCKGAANSLGAKRICKQRGINLVSEVKRIRGQYGIHQCPFRRGFSLGGERPTEVISLPMEGQLVSRLQFLHISWLTRSFLRSLAFSRGSEIARHIAFSSSEFTSTNRAHPGRQCQCGSSGSHPGKERTEETPNWEGIASHLITFEHLQQHFGSKREDVAKTLGISVSTFKRVCRHHGIHRWPNRIRKRVLRPPDPHGEKYSSPVFNTHSAVVQITMENEMGGQNPEPHQFQPNAFEDLNFWNTENGSMAEMLHDWEDYLALEEEPSVEGHVLTMAACSNPAPSLQPIPTIPDTMPTIHMMPHNTAREDIRSVTLKVTYGKIIIKFRFPLTSGIDELKKEVTKRLKLEPDSFRMEYKDEEGDGIFLGCDEDLRNHLQLFNNQVIKLLVVDSDTMNVCGSCCSLTRKGP